MKFILYLFKCSLGKQKSSLTQETHKYMAAAENSIGTALNPTRNALLTHLVSLQKSKNIVPYGWMTPCEIPLLLGTIYTSEGRDPDCLSIGNHSL